MPDLSFLNAFWLVLGCEALQAVALVGIAVVLLRRR